MDNSYKIIKEETIESAKNFKHQLVDATIRIPGNREVVWQYIKTRDVVCIAAINNQNEIYCVRQWRPARKEYVWELPAGGIDEVHPTKERILENASRELQEEIGYRANKIELLVSFSPTIHMACTYYVVLAKDLEKSSLPGDSDENVEARAIPLDEALTLLTTKQLPSALTLVGMMLVKEHLKQASG